MRVFFILCLVFLYNTAESQTCNVGSPALPDDRFNAVALIKIGAPINFEVTGFLVNHPSEDGRYWMITSAFPFTDCNGPISLQGATTEFHWKVNGQNVITTGATLLDVKKSFALLELTQAPPFEYVTHLGVLNVGTPSAVELIHDCITHSTDQFEPTLGPNRHMQIFPQWVTPSSQPLALGTLLSDIYAYSCPQGVVDLIAPNQFLGTRDAFFVDFWIPNFTMHAPQKGKGSPLFNFNDRVVGIFEAQSVSSCTSTLQNALFVPTNDGTDGTDNLAGWFNNQNTNSRKIKRCLPFKEVVNSITQATEINVSDYISANSSAVLAGNLPVIFKAGNYIELNPGFESNTNFEASIQSGCTTIVLPINRIAHPSENPINSSAENSLELKSWFSSEQLMIESAQNMGEVEVALYDIQGKLVILPPSFELETMATINTYGLTSGVYLLYIKNNNVSRTIKVVKL
jgi:Secretion system C-terminal sorting domain